MDVREKQSSEKRLIDADAFLEKMKRTSRYFDVVFDVEEMPTVDAVEVVRCRECKRWESHCNGKAGICQKRKGVVRANDFCSYGERKEGAD